VRVASSIRDDERGVADLHCVRVVERLAVDLYTFDHAEKVAARHIVASLAEEEPDFIEHATIFSFEARARDA
jgi:hypothetical protein